MEFGRDSEGNFLVTRSTSARTGEEVRTRWNSNAGNNERKPRIDFGIRSGKNLARSGRRDRGILSVVRRRFGREAEGWGE